MRPFICMLFWAIVPALGFAADEWQLRGRVIDQVGQPVPGAGVDFFWRANGTQKQADGSPLDLTSEADFRLLWGNEGRMEPLVGTTTAADGTFILKGASRRHAVMAIDAARQRGGIAVIAKGKEHVPVTIRLAPLVKVRGRFELADTGTRPAFTVARAMVPEDPERPLDNFWVAQCGSLDARFEFNLPPGKYVLELLGAPGIDDVANYSVTPYPELIVTGDSREQDPLVFRLEKPQPTKRDEQMAHADADGTWGDYTEHYGQPPPKWHVVDARGLKKDTELADFHGKWLLVYFWGLSCPHCLGDHLPRLMKFYDDHRQQRDKFEIIAFCTEADNELHSIGDLDKALGPIVQHVWSGRQLPFPTLLDPSFTTMKRYGLRAYGTLLLIDPQGNLVEGDEKTLAEHLKR